MLNIIHNAKLFHVLNLNLQNDKVFRVLKDIKLRQLQTIMVKLCVDCIKSISLDQWQGVSRKRQMGGTKQMVQLIYLKQP